MERFTHADSKGSKISYNKKFPFSLSLKDIQATPAKLRKELSKLHGIGNSKRYMTVPASAIVVLKCIKSVM